jgi:hypothetical protein
METKMKSLNVYLIKILSISLVSMTAWAELVPLTIEETAGIARVDEPAQGGIPLPAGKVRTIKNIRVLAPDKKTEVNSQLKQIGWWYDGSVKWALIHLRVNLQPHEKAAYWLEFGDDVKRKEFSSPLKVTRTADRIMVDTGKLRFTVRTDRFNLIDEAWMRKPAQEPANKFLAWFQKPAAGEEQIVVSTPDSGLFIEREEKERPGIAKGFILKEKPGAVTCFVSNAKDPTCHVEVEEQGPLYMRLRASGWHIAPNGEKFCQYIVRITAYADSAELRVAHTFIYTGRPDKDFIAGMGMRIGLVESKEQVKYYAGTGTQLSVQPSGSDFSVKLLQDSWNSFSLRSDNSNPVGGGADPGNSEKTGLTEASYRRPAVSENKPKSPTVGTYASPNLTHNSREIATGLDSGGYMDICGSAGVLAVVRDAAKLYPKAITGTKQGLTVEFWPSGEDLLLDLRRTSDGTQEGEDGPEYRWVGAEGVARTHDVLYDFHAASVITNSRQMAQAFYHPLHVAAAPEWYAETRVVGELGVQDYQSFPNNETQMTLAWKWLRAHQAKQPWYGMMHYGNFRPNYDGKKWSEDGRYGWRNAAPDMPRAFALQFMRSGERGVYDLLEANTREIMDVVTVHWKPEDRRGSPVGAMHKRGRDPWSGTPQDNYTFPAGMFMYYFLSGDPRALEVGAECADYFSKYPGGAMTLHTFLKMWEATGNPEWRQKAKASADYFFTRNLYRDNFRKAGEWVPLVYDYYWIMGRDEAAKKALVQEAYFHAWPGSAGVYDTGFLIPASYRLSGDRTLMDYSVRYMLRNFTALPENMKTARNWTDEQIISNNFISYGGGQTLNVGLGLMDGAYTFGAVKAAGYTEESIRQLKDFVSLDVAFSGRRLPPEQTIAPTNGYRFEPLDLGPFGNRNPFQDPFGLGNDPVWKDARGAISSLAGWPFGATLVVNGITFDLAGAQSGRTNGVIVTLPGSRVTLPVGRTVARVHLLGSVAGRSALEKGAVGARYTLRYDDETEDRFEQKNFAHYEHMGMRIHWAPESVFGALRGGNHLNVLSLDAKPRTLREIVFEPGEADHRLLVMAVTVEAEGTEKAVEPVVRLLFGSGNKRPGWTTVGPNPREAEVTGIQWSAPLKDGYGFGSNLRCDTVNSLHVNVPEGRYEVGLKIGGPAALDLTVCGYRLGPVSDSRNELRFAVPVGEKGFDLTISPNAAVGSAKDWTISELSLSPTDKPVRLEKHEDPLIEIRKYKNFARGASAASEHGCLLNYKWCTPLQAIDGDLRTAFISNGHTPENDLRVTMEKTHKVNAIVLVVEKQKEGQEFHLQYGAGNEWRDLPGMPAKFGKGREQRFFRFAPVETGAIRLWVPKNAAEMSIVELEIYGEE